MILPFSTQLNGKPTYFVEKILKALYTEADIKNNLIFAGDISKHVANYALFINKEKESTRARFLFSIPKLHTIREDKKDRWKEGTKIHFFINCRKKNMFRFAPIITVVSTQEFLICYEIDHYSNENRPTVWIDGLLKYDKLKRFDNGMLEIAQNDGFKTIEDFFAYFNEDFTGKIIHWTDKKY